MAPFSAALLPTMQGAVVSARWAGTFPEASDQAGGLVMHLPLG